MTIHSPATDDRGLYVIESTVGDVMRLGQGKSSDRARASAALAKDPWSSEDGRRTAYMPSARWIAPTAVRVACEFLEIPLPEVITPWSDLEKAEEASNSGQGSDGNPEAEPS